MDGRRESLIEVVAAYSSQSSGNPRHTYPEQLMPIAASPSSFRPGASLFLAALIALPMTLGAREDWLEYPAADGPGQGRHIVLISGDEEYRSEEALPLLGRILSRHGFQTTVLFAINPETGLIDPDYQQNIPGLERLADADLMVMFLRFRELPDEQMKHIVDYVESGRPIIGLRTATHAFFYRRSQESPYAHYGFRSTEWPGGFGQQVLGDTWVNHHGEHKVESTRGVINPDQKHRPILRGVEDIWGPTDVYGLANLPDDANVLVLGQVLSGMSPDDDPVDGDKNQPMVPIAWTRTNVAPGGSRVFTTTMGASVDLESEGLRRLLVNAAYWALELEAEIDPQSDIAVDERFKPTFYGFGEYRQGLEPEDLR